MIGFRLVTTGLNKDIHSVIGYEVHTNESIERCLIQPSETTKFDGEAMKDINKLSISSLKAIGQNRQESLSKMLEIFESDETVLVWYEPFINMFLRATLYELSRPAMPIKCLDMLSIAKDKEFRTHSFNLADVMEALHCFNMVQLFEKLINLTDKPSFRRL